MLLLIQRDLRSRFHAIYINVKLFILDGKVLRNLTVP